MDALHSARPSVIESSSADGRPALVYAGLPEGHSHVLPFLEQRRGGPATRRRSATSWAEMFAGRAAPGADLAIAGCLPGRPPPPGLPRTLTLPFRITLVVPVTDGPEAVLRAVSRKARQQHARELVSRSRTLQVATGEEDFAFFYDRLHEPTMSRRHGAASRSVARETARRSLFHRGQLFFLCEDGERVAGMLCRRERDTLVVRLAGVLDGGEQAYRSGTYMSMYILILRWAAEQGLDRVDLSGCEPFLSKGILQFKRKLHPVVTPPANHFGGKRLWLQVRRDSPGIRDFLVANPPLIRHRDGTLRALYFHDGERPPRTDLRWESPGIGGARLADLDLFLAGEPAAAWAARPLAARR